MPPNAVIGTCSGYFLPLTSTGPISPLRAILISRSSLPVTHFFLFGRRKMDLSHLLVGAEGTNRKHVLINYGRGFFIREKRFRLNQDGNLYDIPITSDASRYSVAIATDPAHAADRTRLTKTLDNFMAIESQYNKSSSNDRKKRERQN